jgi:hypothetical protein
VGSSLDYCLPNEQKHALQPAEISYFQGRRVSSIVIVLINVAIFIALCVSPVQFWRGRRLGSETIRGLAALSSLITLIIVVLLYSGEFLHEVLAALRELGVSAGVHQATVSVVTHVDEFCIELVNRINGALGATEVGYRPTPPAWPAVLLGIGYAIRFLIYRSHTRRGNTESALTGAAYWSFITTYLLLLAYLIVLAQFDPAQVIPISLIILTVVVVGVKVFFEDFGLAVRAVARTLWTEISRAGAFIAYLATEIAAAVRELLSYANRLYIKRIRRPLRRGIKKVEARNKRYRKTADDRLTRQNTAHTRRFRRPPASEDDRTV